MCVNESTVGGSPAPPTTPTRAAPAAALARAVSAVIALTLLAGATPAGAICRFTGATNMTFTGYSPAGAGVAATATLTYRCTGITLIATIAISPTARTMTSGAETLAFELYTDTGTVFPGPSPVNLPITRNGTVIVNGWLGPQDVGFGTYTGTLTATITSNLVSTQTTTFTASATVGGDCTIQPATLAFGPYDPLAGTARDGAATISIACTRGTPYRVGLGAGSHPAGAIRQMAGTGGELLQYELFSDSGRTTPLPPTATIGGTAGSSAAIPISVFGRIPPGQDVAADDYSDVVQSIVNF